MNAPNERATPYNQGYADGVKAARERYKTLAMLQVPIAYVGSMSVLETVLRDGRHMAVLTDKYTSDKGVALYTDPVAATQGNNTLGEVAWKVINSLVCTAAWLENGCDVAQAVMELRLNERMLRHGRVIA